MKVDIFEFDKSGKAKITKHVQDIWYLSAIVDKYGEANALKLFRIFDFVHNLNPDENVFANLPEENKYETILRSTYPELETLIDLEDDLIEQALDLIEELYSTPKYEKYKSLKMAYEKLNKELRFVNVSLDKESGNSAEITKCMAAMTQIEKEMSTAYKEFEEEMDKVTRRGGRDSNDRRDGGKEEVLA